MTQVEAQKVTEIEIDKRMTLAQNKDFIQTAIECAKKMGITAQQWNEDKAAILLLFASKAIAIAQENGIDTFGVKSDKLNSFLTA